METRETGRSGFEVQDGRHRSSRIEEHIGLGAYRLNE